MIVFRNEKHRPRGVEGDPDEARPGREVGRRERAKREKLSRICRAALEAFRLRDFEGATTREIAEAADVGVGTLFLYARDKRELLVLVYEGAVAEISAEALARLFVSEILAGGEGEVRKRSFEGVERLIGRLAERVELAQGRGEVAGVVDPSRAARNLFALYFAELTAFLASDASASEALQEPLREAIGLQLRGLLPRDAT